MSAAVGESTLAELTLRYGTLAEHGYEVEKHGPGKWALAHDDGGGARVGYLMIGDHGCIAPTKAAAIIEGYRRIASDES